MADMQGTSRMTAGAAADRRPVLFVVRGGADDEEIAAATVAVLLALRSRATTGAGAGPAPASGWRPEPYGPPGAWSSC